MIVYIVLIALYTIFDAIKDDIVHHDAYKWMGYFFSKEAAEAPKKNWFHKYFPMFYDMWHLSKTIQYSCLILIITIALQSVIFGAIVVVTHGILFNLVYSYNDK